MKIRLTENDLARIVKRVLNEQPNNQPNNQPTAKTLAKNANRCKPHVYQDIDKIIKTGSNPTFQYIKTGGRFPALFLTYDSLESCWIGLSELTLSNSKFTAVRQDI
jgi:hypothetical protein